MRPRVLLVASTTGYQVRSFETAALRRGIDLVLATDRCHVLDDPWRDRAIPVRFADPDGAVTAITATLADQRLDGVLAVGDQPAVMAAAVAEALSLPSSPPPAVRAASHKLRSRISFRDAGLPCPWFTVLSSTDPAGDGHDAGTQSVTFPCVVKPLALSGSRGVIRADTPEELTAALARVGRILTAADQSHLDDTERQTILVEQYVPGREVAVEGVLTDGALQTLAVFDKPDPLEGPFFEETIYVTPSELAPTDHRRVIQAVAGAVAALGLTWGPVHVECRLVPPGDRVRDADVGDDGQVVVLEVANRPIGGLCARALRVTQDEGEHGGSGDTTISLEELLLRHALGETVSRYRRETRASGVMMIPIEADGLYRGVEGVEAARAVTGVEDVVITAKPDQRLQRLPEGGSYLGFIFARADRPSEVVRSLRESHEQLQFRITPVVPVTRLR